MSVERPEDSEPKKQVRTLGDVLYSRGPRNAIAEKAWVDLVKSIASGDQVALHSLYERTHRLVFTLLVRITNNGETAEELTVDVFHDVWRRASSYDPANGSVLGWIMNQARSRAIDRLRYEQRKKRAGDDSKSDTVVSSNEDPQVAFQREEQNHHLRKALSALNHEERQAIEMAFFQELTYREVAVTLNEPLGTVKSRIRSGLSKLRSAIAQKERSTE
jgi:RNA polymerase sigma-70 factor (ECF subfamily)